MNSEDLALRRDNTGEAASPKSNLLDSNPHSWKDLDLDASFARYWMCITATSWTSLPLFSSPCHGHDNITLLIKLSWGYTCTLLAWCLLMDACRLNPGPSSAGSEELMFYSKTWSVLGPLAVGPDPWNSSLESLLENDWPCPGAAKILPTKRSLLGAARH